MQPQFPAPRTGTTSPQTNRSPEASHHQAWAGPGELPAPQEMEERVGSLRGATRGDGAGRRGEGCLPGGTAFIPGGQQGAQTVSEMKLL